MLLPRYPFPVATGTYDLSTNAGKVRLLIADTNAADVLFLDGEIDAFLTMAGNGLHRAAAMAVRAIVADRAKLAKRVRREGYESEEFAVSDLLKLADTLEAQEGAADGGIQVGQAPLTDDHFEAFRPTWVDGTEDLVG